MNNINILDVVGNEPRQELFYILNNGEQVKINLSYKPRFNFWNIDIKYKNKEVKNTLVDFSQDLFYQYSNFFPFKIVVLSNTGLRPFYLDDFINGNCLIGVIDESQ